MFKYKVTQTLAWATEPLNINDTHYPTHLLTLRSNCREQEATDDKPHALELKTGAQQISAVGWKQETPVPLSALRSAPVIKEILDGHSEICGRDLPQTTSCDTRSQSSVRRGAHPDPLRCIILG